MPIFLTAPRTGPILDVNGFTISNRLCSNTRERNVTVYWKVWLAACCVKLFKWFNQKPYNRLLNAFDIPEL